ncbi:MAG: hypothetical protein KUG59_09510 [Parvibaculaceae bacterium]|nr:hypothetical protein [Parvibaculaceae bacterium]
MFVSVFLIVSIKSFVLDIHNSNSGPTPFSIIFLLVAVYFSRSLFQWATIMVDEHGISARLAGRITKKITWADVQKVQQKETKTRRRRQTRFFVVDKRQNPLIAYFHNLGSSISFTNEGDGLPHLSHLINTQSAENNFPLYKSTPTSSLALTEALQNSTP